jgi:hypothetical protein
LGERRKKACRNLVEKLLGRHPFRRPRNRTKDNIKIDLSEIGYVDRR